MHLIYATVLSTAPGLVVASQLSGAIK